MADTQRTIAELKALLADNCAGEISPQDLRDLVETFDTSAGMYYITTPAVTDLGSPLSPGDYTKVLGTTTAIALKRFTHSNNRLTYTGAATVNVLVQVVTSVRCQFGGREIGMKVAKNGVVVDHSEILRDTGNNTLGAVSTMAMVTLANGDYIEVFTANNDDDKDVTYEKMVVRAVGLPG